MQISASIMQEEGVEDGGGAMRATRRSRRKEEQIRVLSTARYHQFVINPSPELNFIRERSPCNRGLYFGILFSNQH
jgi:hypothetical protein